MKDTARRRGFFDVETQLGWFVMFSHELFVCTTCFSLTGLGLGMQRCRCEEYKTYPGVDCPNGYILCYMCGTEVTGGPSRGAWNACESCLKFNRYLARAYGFQLPLGRHSIMNSVGIPIYSSKEVQKEATKEMFHFLNVAGSIEDWGVLQARELFESVYSWQKMQIIPLAIWEAKFHLSTVRATTRSGQAFKDYLRIDDFEELARE